MTVSPWNYAPRRLWKRVSIYVRPDIHTAIRDHGENMTLLLNNALARKYGLDPCSEGGARRVRRLRRLEETTAGLEHEIAALSVDLQDDRLGAELRSVLEQQYADFVATRDERAMREVREASRIGDLRDALDAIIGESSLARYRRALPENDPSGDRIDDLDDLVARLSRRTGIAVEPAEVAAEVRLRAARADAGEGP